MCTLKKGSRDASTTTRTIAEYLTATRVYAQSLEALADAVANDFAMELHLACVIAGVPMRRAR